MMENLKIVKDMVQEYITMLIKPGTMGSGRQIRSMAQESTLTLTVVSIRVILLMTKDLGKGYLTLLIKTSMKESGEMIRSTERGYFTLLMEIELRESGRMMSIVA